MKKFRNKKKRNKKNKRTNPLNTLNNPSTLPQQTSNHRTSISKVTAQFYSGIIPHPDFMRQYNELLPGSADRILTMTEKQEDHRIDIEKKQLQHNINQSKMGLSRGFIILMTVILTGAVLLILGRPIEGFSSMGTGLASMFFGYLKAIRSQKDEREKRAELLQQITNMKKK